MLKTLREPRYAALGALMIVVALACVAAGTWQIFRFEQKRHENGALRHNAHAAPTTVTEVLPLVGSGETPSVYGIQLRTVRVSGRYDPTLQTLVRNRSVDDMTGFLVLTPLRTAGGTLLVVRGFLPQPGSGAIPKPAAPPLGRVEVSARVYPPEPKHDAAATLSDHQVESINPGEQASRLGGPVYNGFVELLAHQPGTHGLTAMPAPSLGNPAGGALEPQHFAYIIQWYLFAVLALAAPVVMARSETKQPATGDVDADSSLAAPPTMPEPPPPTAEELRTAKLADRYGRPIRR